MFKKWTIKDIKEVLNEAVEKGGVPIDDVEIKISTRRTRRNFGTCTHIKTPDGIKTIRIQISYWLANGYYDEATVRNTILHEYAHHHANTIHGESCKHDYRWKQSCKLVGAKPQQYASGYECDYEQLRKDRAPKEYNRKTEKNGPKYKVCCKECGQHEYKYRLQNGMEWYQNNYICKCGGSLNIEVLR